MPGGRSPMLWAVAAGFCLVGNVGAETVASGWLPVVDNASATSQMALSLGLTTLLCLALLIALVRRGRQLQAAQQRLVLAATGHQSILSSLPDPVWMKDRNGVFLACNPAFAALFGKSIADIVGSTMFELTSAEQARQARRRDAVASESGRPVDDEEWFRFASTGHSSLLLTTRVPVFDDAGKLAGIVGICHDVTELRRTEEELRKRASYQRALIDNFPFMVWLKDTEGLFLAANQHVAAAAGLSESRALIGKSDFDLWPTDLANAYRADDQHVMTTRRSREVQEELAQGGERRWVETYKAPVVDERGDLLGTIGFARDVSERRRMEQMLRESEAHFRAFFENNTAPMLLMDPANHVIIEGNAAAAKYYGYDLTQLAGMSIQELDALSFEQLSAIREDVLAGRKQQLLRQHRLANGAVREVEIHPSPIELDGKVVVFTIIHDVTDRVSAERALARERDLFSAGPVVVFALTPEPGWPVQQVSSNVQAILGYTEDEVAAGAMKLADAIHPDDLTSVHDELQHYLATGGERFEQSFRLRHKNGAYAWYRQFVQIDRDPDGQVRLIRGYLVDQSSLKALELSLADERNRLAAVIEGTRVGTWVWNVQSGETRFNERWAEIIGYRLAELMPVSIDTWTQFVHPDDLPRSSELLRRHFAGELGYYECEVRMRHRDGHWVWVLDRGQVLDWSDDGQPLWMYGTHLDIGERKLAEQALKDSENRLRIAGEITYDLIYESHSDGRLDWFGDADAFFALPPGKTPRHLDDWLSLVHPDDVDQLRRDVAARDETAELYEHHYRVLRGDGEYRYLTDQGSPVQDEQTGTVKWVGVCTDVTEQHLAEERLRLAAAVFDSAQEGIMITDAQANVIEVNTAFAGITGYRRDEVIGQNPRFLHSGYHSADFYASMWRDLTEHGYWQGEIRNRNRRGEVYAELLSISALRNDKGDICNYVGMFSDITALKDKQDRLEHIAYYDPLTQLPNRILLNDRIRLAIAQASRLGNTVALLYVDLDGFKQINDRFGHDLGDRVLIEIAGAMRNSLRAHDTVARLGGDEFVALMTDLPNSIACIERLPRLLAAISRPLRIGDDELQLSASIGVTFYSQGNDIDAQHLLNQADQAMYQAKAAGKNRYYVYDGALRPQPTGSTVERALSD